MKVLKFIVCSSMLSSSYLCAQTSRTENFYSLGVKASSGEVRIVQGESGDAEDATTFALDFGYHIPTSPTAQFSFGLELGQGVYKATDSLYINTTNGSQNVDIDYTFDASVIAVAKAGYGLRLGESSLAMVGVSLGTLRSEAEVKMGDLKGTEKMNGRLIGVNLEAVTPIIETISLSFGLSYQRLTFDAPEHSASDDLRLNAINLSLGARYNIL